MDTPQNVSTGAWRVKIDYLSVTSPTFHKPQDATNEGQKGYRTAAAYCLTRDCPALAGDEHADRWTPAPGRSGYVQSEAHDSGARFFTGHASAPPLLELPGASCDVVHASGGLVSLAVRRCDGITRLDLAGDVETDLSPTDFLGAGHSSRTRSFSRVSSDQGETIYLGSPKSDRRLRIYRYAAPHPRWRFLRVEVMMRGELAKNAAIALASASVANVWADAVAPYGLAHPLMYAARQDRVINPTLRKEPTSASRLRWIHKQVLPALLEANNSGLIDLRALIDQALGGK